MPTGYRLVIQEGSGTEDRSTVGKAGLEPESPAMNLDEALRLKEVLFASALIEPFETTYVMEKEEKPKGRKL